jgi:hypothetical protein
MHYLKNNFWLYVTKTSACWLWTGALTRRGYGHFAFVDPKQGRRRQIGAHRFSYELIHGPLPKDILVHHKCENKLCVNPDHLEALTALEHRRTHPGHYEHVDKRVKALQAWNTRSWWANKNFQLDA